MTATDQEVLRAGAGAVETARDVVVSSGADLIGYLQGQVSQDVDAIPEGGSAWSLVLEPQGKLVARFRITRRADDLVLDVEAGWGDVLVARLERFRLRVDAQFDLQSWRMVSIRGARVPELGTPAAAVAAPVDWAGLPGFDLLDPAPVVPDGVTVCAAEAIEAIRIEAGVPVMGAELTEGMIAAEAGIVEQSVSFTKGCFTGQELVARIDSRGGNTPRRLRGLVVEGESVPAAGDAVVLDGDAVGAVTSAAWSQALGAPVALAYLARRVELPAPVAVGDGGTAARAVELPLLRAS